MSQLHIYKPHTHTPPPPLKHLSRNMLTASLSAAAVALHLLHRRPRSSCCNSLHFHTHPRFHNHTTVRSRTCKSTRICAVNNTSPSANEFSLTSSENPLARVASLEAILFDIDGTLCDSDPIHYYAFREMLQEVGFNGGVPITEDFYINNLSGMHNEELCHSLFPDWEIEKSRKFLEDKEAMFRRLASEKLEPMKGLNKLCQWITERGLKRAAVTNAPRANAEFMISSVGLDQFFETLVVGSECERAKPFPDPYLNALNILGVSHKHAFAFEDSASGTKAGVAAGMPVVGLVTRNPEYLLAEAGASFVIKDFLDPKLWTALEELDKVETQRQITSSPS